jgi:hypothetical protein
VAKRALVLSAPADVRSRLLELGLQPEQLRQAVQLGVRYRFDCTANDPICAPGFIAWAKIVRSLREALLIDGWIRNSDRGYETTLSADGTLAITVASGDQFTGNEDGTPSNRREKGQATREAVTQNMLPFEDLYDRVRPNPGDPRLQTWILLHYFDTREDEVRLELSLPDAITPSGFVKSWRERIILEPISFKLQPIAEADDDESGDIEVSVIRRG